MFFFSVVPIIAYGEFDNEFLRICILMTAIAFTFWANLHWVLRLCGIATHIFIILFIEGGFFRELLMQCACMEKGRCAGGNNFNELAVMKALKFSDGSVLIEGKISWEWMNVLFWRSFLVMYFHYMAVLLTGSLSLRLGWTEQRYIETQVEEEVERPSEDNATMFMFIKQVFYHKTLAYTKFEKKKRSGFYSQGCCKKKKEDEPMYNAALGED
jgi:hypothetical protein